jgi:hypothetical protein
MKNHTIKPLRHRFLTHACRANRLKATVGVNFHYAIERTTPPSTRNAAPVVADAAALHA